MDQTPILLVDAHEDIAYNALEWGRDIREAASAIREREARQHPDYANPDAAGGIVMSGLPDLRRGGFGIVFSTLFTFPCSSACEEVGSQYTQTQTYNTPDEAWHVAQKQLAYYRELVREPGLSLIQTRSDLATLLDAWREASPEAEQRPVGLVILMEGADPIRTPDEVEQWFADGLRIIGPAWNSGTRYAGGNVSGGPLTSDGRKLLAEMQRLGIALDTTHLSEESFWEALASFQGPVLASHSNCRAIVPRERELSDEMIRAIAERDGVVGIVPFNNFLVPGWSRASGGPVALERMVAHIDHVCQLTGNARHVGIGSDIDGGFGRDETPVELDTVADLLKLSDALLQAGYTREDVRAVMGGNWQRFLARILP